MVKLNLSRRENIDVYWQSWGLICDAYSKRRPINAAKFCLHRGSAFG